MPNNLYKRGDLIRIAQDTPICEYIKNEKTLYFRETTPKSIFAIYVRKFSEYNEELCEVIVGDKIRYVAHKDIRDAENNYHGINF